MHGRANEVHVEEELILQDFIDSNAVTNEKREINVEATTVND